VIGSDSCGFNTWQPKRARTWQFWNSGHEPARASPQGSAHRNRGPRALGAPYGSRLPASSGMGAADESGFGNGWGTLRNMRGQPCTVAHPRATCNVPSMMIAQYDDRCPA
jgi:hypothetical protein